MGKPDLQRKETTIRYTNNGIPTTTTQKAADRYPSKRGGQRDIKIVSDEKWSELYDTK